MPTNTGLNLKTIVDFCRRKGFVYQSSEIYGGFAATYDFGPLGTLLKKNIEQQWRQWNVSSRIDMVEIEGAIFMHPKTWEASGHIGGFSDLLVEDLVTRKRYRADHLVEDARIMWPLNSYKFNKNAESLYLPYIIYFAKYNLNKIWLKSIVNHFKKINPENISVESEVENLVQKLLESDKIVATSDNNEFVATENLFTEVQFLTEAGSLSAEEIDQVIEYYNLKSPDGNPLSKAKKFNLMVKTHLGPVEDDTTVAYLKGESCQNIYLNWKAVQETTRRKLPFGIAQIGKAFRNEITVKQFMFRTREFEQMDVQYFVKPGEEDKWYEHWKNYTWDFYVNALGLNPENLRWRQHTPEERAFYAKDAWDIEYHFGEMGWKELGGLHNRTSYDTDQHGKFSGQDLSYLDPETNQRYNPYIIEASLGFNRMFLACLFEFYKQEQIPAKID